MNLELLNIVAVLLSLSSLLIVFSKLRKLERREKTKEIDKRLRLLEEELEEYIERSRKRLNIFKKVVDGVDGVIQNIKIAMDDEELDKDALSNNINIIEEEAEVIHIDE